MTLVPGPPSLSVGIAIPHYGQPSNRGAIEAAVETAERLGWGGGAWVQDHLLVDAASRDLYGRVFEALGTLAFVAGRTRTLILGTSVVVAPMRDGLLLAKELATIDALTGGRLIVGVGAGWSRAEFENLGHARRFPHRGAYLDETIALWRHLWSGERAPFEGRFYHLVDYEFAPLPERRGGPPIWVGGRSLAAYRRAGRLGDGFHSGELMRGPDQYAEAARVVREASALAGRPSPLLSARVNVRFGRGHRWPGYAIDGTPDEMRGELERFRALGVAHLVCNFWEHDPDRLAAVMTRFTSEVIAALRPSG
jgi:probable F420-dependent oxidoreductase